MRQSQMELDPIILPTFSNAENATSRRDDLIILDASTTRAFDLDVCAAVPWCSRTRCRYLFLQRK